jgi:hypothetical protein
MGKPLSTIAQNTSNGFFPAGPAADLQSSMYE